MLDKVNRDRHEHIINGRRPYGYLHAHRAASSTREKYTRHAFIRNASGCAPPDPDVVLIGEMRDLETTETGSELPNGPPHVATLHRIPRRHR